MTPEQYASLLARIEALEARPVLRYCGIYQAEASYEAGNFVTHNGSVWHCTAPTAPFGIPPGRPNSGWRLAVKKGRNGRDGRDGDWGLSR